MNINMKQPPPFSPPASAPTASSPLLPVCISLALSRLLWSTLSGPSSRAKKKKNHHFLLISFHIHLCCCLAAFMLHATFRIQVGYVAPRCAGGLQRERPWTLMGAKYIQRKNFAFSVFNIVCLEFCLRRGWHLCKTAGRAAPGLDPAENKAGTPENERTRVLQSFPKPASLLIPLYILTRLPSTSPSLNSSSAASLCQFTNSIQTAPYCMHPTATCSCGSTFCFGDLCTSLKFIHFNSCGALDCSSCFIS